MTYAEVNILRILMEKFRKSFSEHAMNIINFKMKKNETINKRAAGII